MKIWLVTLGAAIGALLGALPSAQMAPPRFDWIQLFNGNDLSGWTPKCSKHDLGVNLHDTFRVEEGLLKVRYDKWTAFNGEFGHLFYKDMKANTDMCRYSK